VHLVEVIEEGLGIAEHATVVDDVAVEHHACVSRKPGGRARTYPTPERAGALAAADGSATATVAATAPIVARNSRRLVTGPPDG
jgi:hypothetical protein